MKFLFSALALAFGALAFQSCEVYPNGTSRGYNHGDGYVGDQHDGGGDVVVSSGYSEHHGDGYNNGYYSGENAHADRDVQTNRNVNVNRNAQVNRNVHVNQKAHGNSNVQAKPNTHGKTKVKGNPNTEVHKQ
jgi:hypothetical protein